MINTISIIIGYLAFCGIVMGIAEYMYHKKMKEWLRNRDSLM